MKSTMFKATFGEVWYLGHLYHREDGPAVSWLDGSMAWYQYGVLHRLDGPAAVLADGQVEFWIKGNRYDNVIDYARDAKWTEKQLADYLLLN